MGGQQMPIQPPPMSPTSISYQDPRTGTWIWNPQTNEAWRMGSSGGEHMPVTDQPGRGQFSQLPPDIQKTMRSQYDTMQMLLHPPEFSMEFPEIELPDFSKEARDREASESRAKTAKAERQRHGRRASILTGPAGLTTPAPVGKKTLLGE